MGLLDIIPRIGLGIITGGTSEIARLVAPNLVKSAEGLFFPTNLPQAITTLALGAGVAPAAIATVSAGSTFIPGQNVFLGPTHGQPRPVTIPTTAPIIPAQGVNPMGLESILSPVLGIVGNLLGGASASPVLQTVGQALTSFQPNFGPAPQPMQAMTVASSVPAIRSTSLTQDVFNAGVKLLGRLGIPYRATSASFTSALKRSLASIGSLARRTPAGTIVSILVGLGLAVQEANLLVAWHAQRRKGRRMNPANAKALRRAAKRIKSFHKLCIHTDLIKTGRRSKSFARCRTCRKSPCAC